MGIVDILLYGTSVAVGVSATAFFGYIGYCAGTQFLRELRDPEEQERSRLRNPSRSGFLAPYHSTVKALTIQKLREAVAVQDWTEAERLARSAFPTESGAMSYVAEKKREVGVTAH